MSESAIDRDELRSAVCDVLDRTSSRAAVQAMVDPVDPAALDAFWHRLTDLGWTGIDIADQ